MSAVLTFTRPRRPVNCAACGALLWTSEPPPHCCDPCADAVHDEEMAKFEAQARAAGYASLEEQMQHEMLQAYIEEAMRAVEHVRCTPDLRLSRAGFDVSLENGHRTGPDFDAKCVATALAYIDHGPVKRQHSVTRWSPSSYYLKHRAEDWGETNGFSPYVGNGDFIAAAIWSGVPFKRDRWRGPNCQVALLLEGERG